MKEQILDIAVRQMRVGGYDNLNFANISSELGTSRANLHHHYKNKEGLGIAATEVYIQNEKAWTDEIFRVHDGNIREVLSSLEDHLIEILAGNEASAGCILSQVINDGEAPESLRKLALNRIEEEEGLIAQQFLKAQKSGAMSNTQDAKSLAFRVMASMFGVTQMGLIRQDKAELTRNIRGSLVSLLE